MSYLMRKYDRALEDILEDGVWRTNKRTGIRTKSLFGVLARYKLDDGDGRFPIVTARKMFPKSVFAELLWFLSGSTNNADLKELGCKFWEPWVDQDFESKHGYAPESFGPVYGFQLRHFGGYYGNGIGGETGTMLPTYDASDDDPFLDSRDERIYGNTGFDQLKFVVERIKEDYSCRRTLWTLWNPHDVSKMRLPPCHMLFQVFVDDERRMTTLLYQRSADFPVGVPANIQFYSALTIMLAQQTDCTPHEFVHVTGDTHVYEDQIEAVEKYLAAPKPASPKLTINKAADILSYKPEDFVISEYNPGPKIEIPVAVGA